MSREPKDVFREREEAWRLHLLHKKLSEEAKKHFDELTNEVIELVKDNFK